MAREPAAGARGRRGRARGKVGVTAPPQWSKTGAQGPPMSVRATILAFLFGAMVLGVVALGALVVGHASAAERTGASSPPTSAPNHFPVASDVRLGGDDTQTRLIVDLSEKIDIRAFT